MAGHALGFFEHLLDSFHTVQGLHRSNLYGGTNYTGTRHRRALIYDIYHDLHTYNRHLHSMTTLPNISYNLVAPEDLPLRRAATGPAFISRPQTAYRDDANVVPDINDDGELEEYIDSLPSVLNLSNVDLTNAQARQYLIDKHVISANLQQPTWSYIAMKIWYDIPIIRQIMFLLTIADTSPLFGINFDEWFKEAFNEDDFILFGAPDVLSKAVTFLPGGSAGAALNAQTPYIPTISNIIRNMQNPDLISYLIYSVYLVARSIDPHAQLRWILRVLTRRKKANEDASIYLFKGTDPNGALSGVVSSGLGITGSNNLENIRTEVLAAMFQKFVNRDDSQFILSEDRVTVLGINFLFESSYVPTPLHSLPVNVTPGLLQVRVRDMLKHMKAYRIPKELFDSLARLSIKHPSDRQYPNNCIIEAFMFMRLHQMGRINDKSTRQEMMELFTELTNELDISTIKNMDLYEALRSLLLYEEEHIERHDMTGMLVLNFFGGFGKPPPCRSVRIILDGQELHFEMPENGAYVFTDMPETLELVYYRGHLMTCYHQQFIDNIQTEGSYHKRLMHMTDNIKAKEFCLKPINIARQNEIKLKREKRIAITASTNILSKVVGCYCPATSQCKSSADLETGTCSGCSYQEKREVQEAFSCGLAWGTSLQESICFNGQECLRELKDNPSVTLENAPGCISQMLNWLKSNWGFYLQEQSTQHAPCKVLERVIYWFYGSRFDMFFLKDVLLYWNETIEIMPMNGDILKIRWGQYTFVDFARLYPGFNLDKCYATFKKIDIGEHAYLRFQPESKWKCFPYKAIRSGMFLRDKIDMEDLRVDNDIWGSKKANEEDPRPIGVVNAEWWEYNISSEGFIIDQHLRDYCISDVLILQYCVYVHSQIMAIGTMETSMGTKMYDLNHAITCSNMAMTLFRQVFLFEEICSPNLENDETARLNWIDEKSHQRLSVNACFQDAMKGGKTDCFRHSMYHEERDPLMKEWMCNNPGKAYTVDDFDVNSMYPHIMESQLMPVTFEGVVELDMEDGINLNAAGQFVDFEGNLHVLVDYYLYWVQVKYPEGQSGILSKACGFCVSLQQLQYCYDDPFRKDRMTYTMIYGRELRVAQTIYPDIDIRCRLYFKFQGMPLFKEYITTLYQKRLESTSDMFKTFYKLMMNSTFGKLAQGLKPTSTLQYNNFDLLSMDENLTIVDLQQIPGPGGELINMVSTIDYEKPYIGQFIYMAAYITAGARSLLEELICDARKCINVLGLPCLLYYVDTDSIKICSIANTSENQWFIDKWVHQKKLGMIKCEGTYDWIVMLGKKCGFFHEQKEDAVVTTKEELIASLQSSGLKQWHVKSKGVPSKIVKPADLLEVYVSGERKTFNMPDQLKRELTRGISATSGAIRSIGFRNLARRPPDSNGDLKPYKDVFEFISRMRDKSIQEKLQGVIHLE